MKSQTAARPNDFASLEAEERSNRRKKKKRKYRRRKIRNTRIEDTSESSSISSSSASSRSDHHRLLKRDTMLEKERQKLYRKWKKEAKVEERAKRKLIEENRWYRRLFRHLHSELSILTGNIFCVLAWMESFFANLPLTIGAIALACANLGVDWFKFTEGNLKSCNPVHFHSAQCTFPEVRFRESWP
jgi:hypothetical protein